MRAWITVKGKDTLFSRYGSPLRNMFAMLEASILCVMCLIENGRLNLSRDLWFSVSITISQVRWCGSSSEEQLRYNKLRTYILLIDRIRFFFKLEGWKLQTIFYPIPTYEDVNFEVKGKWKELNSLLSSYEDPLIQFNFFF